MVKSSKYKGVTKRLESGKWRAYIYVKGNRINLGTYVEEDDAAMEYNFATVKYNGIRARLNIIGVGYAKQVLS